MTTKSAVVLSVNLTQEQIDTLVVVLNRIGAWCDPSAASGVDALARRVTQRRCTDIINVLRKVYPDAGK